MRLGHPHQRHVWRLYGREVSSTASEYYEINLTDFFAPPVASPKLGGLGRYLDALKRWWLFFRRAAFIPDSQGHSFVRCVHEGSATYAKEISDKLKDLVSVR